MCYWLLTAVCVDDLPTFQCCCPKIMNVTINTLNYSLIWYESYLMFYLLGFIELPGLTTEDHVTLTIIERYLDFKVLIYYWILNIWTRDTYDVLLQVVSLRESAGNIVWYPWIHLFHSSWGKSGQRSNRNCQRRTLSQSLQTRKHWKPYVGPSKTEQPTCWTYRESYWMLRTSRIYSMNKNIMHR